MADHRPEKRAKYSASADIQPNGHTTKAINEDSNGYTNGSGPSRATEAQDLLSGVLGQLITFLQQAGTELHAHELHEPVSKTALVETHPPSELRSILTSNKTLSLPEAGGGQAGILQSLKSILKYSVNTSAPGFLDKLYSAPLPPGIAADLVLSVLNTNLHVYQVSPVLSLIETHVSKALAAKFGFRGPRAGGINVQGGSASNLTSIVIARNTLFPDTKRLGNNAGGLELVMFTSEHGHYSIEKAAQQCGFGSESVIAVPVDFVTGEMDAEALESLIVREKQRGKTPFFVNSTAGSTVLGSFDPFTAISQVARRHGLWMHIDGAWGGSFVFSDTLRERALKGCELADSIAINPHKMLGVPVTCSFLLLKDLRNAHRANTLRAGYLFHDDFEEHEKDANEATNGPSAIAKDEDSDEWMPPDDLADLTLQCGRRGDSLKLFLAWQYYGTLGYAAKIDNAYSVACYMTDLVAQSSDLELVSTNPPPCLQVCFYYAPGGKAVHGLEGDAQAGDAEKVGKRNSAITSRITHSLIARGFMIDFAPALGHQIERGAFFRAVVNISTIKQTVERLVQEIVDIGRAVVQK
ncbi:glutamate decarboxylase [Exophiala viscosa]|uniref:Glutamate decarboxylase n=1 Tax=Exophiala viscosa TaxID=2486360 RepID=A0AAN6DNJ8_9EURO|nr:glutamate decarboxylase [Exophiala viscosa]KAI1621020.1 glutamate decarboxylase [Exophiala viscosa]